MDIISYIATKKRLIDERLKSILPPSTKRPSILHRAMRYAVFSGGKRIRPILTIAAFETCGGRGNSILDIASAVELIHTYTLIHDDLPCMDNDDFRRGKLTCHKKFGEDIAILAGDALLTFGFQILSKSKDPRLIYEVSKAIGAEGVIAGQTEDIRNLKSGIKNQKRAIEDINIKKTATLFSVAVKIGGIFKDIPFYKTKALEKFGMEVGLAFQLTDDVLDNDGYVRLYGKDFTIERIAALIKKAKRHLDVFGKEKYLLSGIVEDLVLKRVQSYG